MLGLGGLDSIGPDDRLVLYPRTQTVAVYRPDGTRHQLGAPVALSDAFALKVEAMRLAAAKRSG